MSGNNVCLKLFNKINNLFNFVCFQNTSKDFSFERLEAADTFIRFDAQGSELLVLRGGLPILQNFKFIKTEVADFEIYEGCCQLVDIESFMEAHGYRERSRNLFARRRAGGSCFDIVYERSG